MAAQFDAGASSTNDQSLGEWFRSEAPPAWEAMERAGDSLHVQCVKAVTTRRDAKPGEDKVVRWRVEFKARPGCLLSHRVQLDQSNEVPSAVEAMNADYGFRITRSGGTAWVLRHASASDKDEVAESIAAMDYAYAHAPWAVLEYGSLSSLWRDRGFNVISVQRAEDGAHGLARVQFSLGEAGRNPKEVTLRNGWLILDPNKYWCIREFSVSIASDISSADIHGAITYDDGGDSLPRPLSYDFTLINRQSRATMDYSFAYEEFDYTAPALDDFRLSAYGLPEFAATDTSARSLRTPAMVAFALGLLLLLAAARLRRGRQPSRST